MTKSEEKKVTKKNRDIAKKTPEKNESEKIENKILEEDKQPSQIASPDKEDIISETKLIEDNALKNNLDNKITPSDSENSGVVVQPSF